jgi:hypothetical protein
MTPIELLREPDGGVTADFRVNLPSDVEQPAGDPGKSLIREVELLRQQVQQLCTAVRGLVQLQSIANQKLDAALKGGVGVDCGVI